MNSAAEKRKWVDYSGAPPIFLPVKIKDHWRGFYLPVKEGIEATPDLVLPCGNFDICADFDFDNPKTDYDYICSLGAEPPVHVVRVGPGEGVVFATELDHMTWWQQQLMLVNGGSVLPNTERLHRVEWRDVQELRLSDDDYLLMNACDHGADDCKEDYYKITIPEGRYVIRYGRYGWENDDLSLILFQFVKMK